MKNIALIMIDVVLGVLMLLIVMTVHGRTNRSMELQSNLSSVMEQTMENMALTKKYDIHNTEEFLADFMSQMVIALDAESDIQITIVKCDKEKGILSVEITVSFQHPNGKIGTVSCERSVILNKDNKIQ